MQNSGKQNLTDRTLKALAKRPAPKGETYDRMDTVVPGFGVRVSETGRRTFILLTRYPSGKNPTRRALGQYGELTLEKARDKARSWIELIEKGIDPRDHQKRQQLEEQRKRENSFAAVAEEFIAHVKRNKLRSAAVMERSLRQKFIKRWGSRPITDIKSIDIKRVVDESVNRAAKYQAFHDFALIRRVFNWALGTDQWGLEVNPCWRLKTKDLIGERQARERVLGDDELIAFWRATERLKYPYTPLYRILALTGLRLSAAAEAEWSEFDLDKREWIIPGARMKDVKSGSGKPFVVPLTDAMIDVLNSLLRFTGGDFLFSNRHGKRPLRSNQFSDVKERLDKLIVEELHSLPQRRGKDQKQTLLPAWVNHDLRRTVRTRLSGLQVNDEVAEAVLAHKRPGIKAVYDKHDYLAEKRDALTRWNNKLLAIVESRPANVVDFTLARA